MNKKTTIKLFTIPEYEKEEKYLSMEHKHGWKLTYITLPCFYHFDECEPEEVVYQLDYNLDIHKNFKQYIQMFEDCGWDSTIRCICPNLFIYSYYSITYKESFYYGLLIMFICMFALYITLFTKCFFIYKAVKRK